MLGWSVVFRVFTLCEKCDCKKLILLLIIMPTLESTLWVLMLSSLPWRVHYDSVGNCQAHHGEYIMILFVIVQATFESSLWLYSWLSSLSWRVLVDFVGDCQVYLAVRVHYDCWWLFSLPWRVHSDSVGDFHTYLAEYIMTVGDCPAYHGEYIMIL